jgi:hypothetical protein
MRGNGVTRSIRVYVGLCCALGAAVLLAAVRADGAFSWRAALGFGVLCLIAETFPVTSSLGTTYSVSFVITIAAIVAAGPAEATAATVLGTVNLRDLRGRPPLKHLFNASQLAISAGLGGMVYVALGGRVGEYSGLLPGALLPLLACTLVNFPANTLLVSGAVAISERRPLLHVWRAQYASLGGTYVAFAFLGLLVGVLYVQMGWASVLFLLMPLLVARHAFQASIKMQGAYDDTVRSLISMFETKDPYTRGHAERVSRLAEMTARAYGLSEERCRAIRYAALMHDIGKLTVLSSVLKKPGKLTPEEYEHMKIHPARGVEIISDIDLLQEAIDGVRHHHERMDGRGYPDGLFADEIPLFAKLIMVSDAFDSMTSTRTYRKAMSIEQALAEISRCAGTQYDQASLEALERALARYGWEPHPEVHEAHETEHEHHHELPAEQRQGEPVHAASV